MKKKVLVVDDASNIREVVCFALSQSNFQALDAPDGKRALEQFELHKPDMVILDIGMPDIDGTEVCRLIRQKSNVPIIFLSARDEELDRVLALELGGDDYVCKPFSNRELIARVKALFRRSGGELASKEANSKLEHGFLSMDTSAHCAHWNGKPLDFTATEFSMVRVLMERPGHVFSRDVLAAGAYQRQTVVSDRTIDSHMRRARAKLKEAGGQPIETVHGVGYKLNDCSALI